MSAFKKGIIATVQNCRVLKLDFSSTCKHVSFRIQAQTPKMANRGLTQKNIYIYIKEKLDQRHLMTFRLASC